MGTLRSHMPWSDKRSTSVDASGSNSTICSTPPSSAGLSARDAGFHALASHLSPVSHLSSAAAAAAAAARHNDPYFTYTYGQDRYGRSGGGATRSVMDIFKRSDSLHNNNKRSLMQDKTATGSGNSVNSASDAGSEHLVFVKFFKHYRCYDLIPVSAKLIVLDTQLIVKKAFHALVSNGQSRPSSLGPLLASSRLSITDRRSIDAPPLV